MPLTQEATVIEGGCNCNAVRLRISIPAKVERPIYPGGGSETDSPVYMPLVCTDHCNDCRTATGALLPFWLLTPMSMVEISLARSEDMSNQTGKLSLGALKLSWRPAMEVMLAPQADLDTSLNFFASSGNRRRSFCSRCGTMVTYNVFPKPPKWPFFDMLDISLGCIDRAHLEGENLQPERQLHWSRGIPWIQDFAARAFDVPKHPTWAVNVEAHSTS